MSRASRRRLRGLALLAAWVVCCGLGAAAGEYPPLCVEIRPEHPLFLFAIGPPGASGAAAYAGHVVQAWDRLPDDLKPYATMQVDLLALEPSVRHAQYRELLGAL